MPTMKKRLSGLLPESLKAMLRPLLRLLKKQAPDRPSGIAIDRIDGYEVAYRKNTADEAVILHSFQNDVFFPGVPEYQPRESDVVIDIGAHIGTFSLLASSKAKRGKVFAIEASNDSYNLLRINVALNQRANVSVHHLAISDTIGTCTLHHDPGNWGHSTVSKLSKSSETVPSTTLEQFMETNQIRHCHFMKLNCEGAEFPILLSASREVLQRFDTILVLYHCDLWRNNSVDDLLAHLKSCGLNCVIRNRSSIRGWLVAVNASAPESKS